MCLFLEVDVCDVFFFAGLVVCVCDCVVCLLCVEREREEEREKKKGKKKRWSTSDRSEILGQCETVPKSIGIVFN